MSESRIGCERTDGEDEGKKFMEEMITTKRGSFGFVRVAIPMTVKKTMLNWCKQSSMKKSEFFRVALMIGVKQLSESINAKKANESYEQLNG